MNINYTNLKINNILSAMKYPSELSARMNEFFSDSSPIERENSKKNIFTFLEMSENKEFAMEKTFKMLSREKDGQTDGFFFHVNNMVTA